MNYYTFQLKSDKSIQMTIKAKNYVEALAAIHKITDSGNYKHIDTIFCNE
jgi:hypothetical protein